jgi:hypothetical protein
MVVVASKHAVQAGACILDIVPYKYLRRSICKEERDNDSASMEVPASLGAAVVNAHQQPRRDFPVIE